VKVAERIHALRDFLSANDQGQIRNRAASSKDLKLPWLSPATLAACTGLFRTCSSPVSRLLSACSQEKQITYPFD
jgi:hypothetical protein